MDALIESCRLLKEPTAQGLHEWGKQNVCCSNNFACVHVSLKSILHFCRQHDNFLHVAYYIYTVTFKVI